MPIKLSEDDLKLLIDATVSLVNALASQSPAPLVSPLKAGLQRAAPNIRENSKAKAIQRNMDKLLQFEASHDEIHAGVAIAAQVAPKFNRSVYLRSGHDKDRVVDLLLKDYEQSATHAEAQIARIALRVILNEPFRMLQDEPVMSTVVAILDQEQERAQEAEVKALLPTPTDGNHDWETGFVAERDRRRFHDPKSAQPLVGLEIAPFVTKLSVSWREEIKDAIHALRTPKCDGRALDAIGAIHRLNLDGSYLSLQLQLQDPVIHSALEVLQEARTADFHTKQDTIVTRSSATWLLGQASRPEMQLVFPVMGQWGSGKARLLLEFSEAWHNLPAPVVFVRRRTRNSLEDTILERCREDLGRQFSSRAQLGSYARNFNFPILIVLERLDEMERQTPGTYNEFAELVELWSEQDAFRWAVTIDQNTLVCMPKKLAREFWPAYGSVTSKLERHSIGDPTQIAGGFLDLDSHNATHFVGLKILSKYGEKRDKMALDLPVPALRDSAAIALSPPVAAWVRIDAQDQLPLDDIHGQVFLTNFWALAFEDMESHGVPENVLVTYVKSVASLLAINETPRVDVAERAAMNRWSGYISDAAKALQQSREALIEWGLVEISGNKMDLPGEYLPLWGYQVALSILELTEDQDAYLRDLDIRAADNDQLAFFALSSAINILLASGDAGVELLRGWLGRDPLSWEPAWEAALEFDTDLLAHFVERQSETLREVLPDRRVYLILRTARLRRFETTQDSSRMIELVARVSPAAKGLGLTDFMFGALVNQLRSVDFSTPYSNQSILAALSRVDEPLYDYQLAQAVVQVARERRSLDEFMPVLANFLDKGAELDFREEHDGLFEGDYSAQDTLPFWRALVRLTLAEQFASHGPEYVLKLMEVDWLRSNYTVGRDPIWFAAVQETNVAFGHAYHEGYRERFIKLVERLAEARDTRFDRTLQREVALFGIRHTEPTFGKSVSVDSLLAPAYRMLLADHQFARTYSNWLRSITFKPTRSG